MDIQYDEYIDRILVDYPERDKIFIALSHLAGEAVRVYRTERQDNCTQEPISDKAKTAIESDEGGMALRAINYLTSLQFQFEDSSHTVAHLQVAIEALREKAERENPQPLTKEELKERTGKPVWMNKAKRWIFIAAWQDAPYQQFWYFNHRGKADTVLYYHEEFYDYEPKGE